MKPATPHSAAGIRTEPAVSVPTPTAAAPVATAPAQPELEPPRNPVRVEWVLRRAGVMVDAGDTERELVQRGYTDRDRPVPAEQGDHGGVAFLRRRAVVLA